MGYERSAWIVLVSTLMLILLVDAQGVIEPLPVEPVPCAGSKCKINTCALKGLKCCQCQATAVLGGISEICACCPQGYQCCGSTMSNYRCCPIFTRTPCEQNSGCVGAKFNKQICKFQAESDPKLPIA